MDSLDCFVIFMIYFGQLALIPYHQPFCLRLPLFHVVVSILLNLLEKGAKASLLLLLEGFKPKLDNLLVCYLFLSDLSGPHFLYLLLGCSSLFVLLNLHKIPG
jgi:hypothetical protein